MKRSFNPRFRWSAGSYPDNYLLGVTGIWIEDFDAILALCEENLKRDMPGATGVEEHRANVTRTIGAMRYKATRFKGLAGVAYQKHWEDPLSAHNAHNVWVGAMLAWTERYDPDNRTLSRLPSSRYRTKDDDVFPIDVARLYHTLRILCDASDAPRLAYFRRWEGAKDGSFGRVVDMTKEEKAKRIEAMKDRKKSADWIASIFRKKAA